MLVAAQILWYVMYDHDQNLAQKPFYTVKYESLQDWILWIWPFAKFHIPTFMRICFIMFSDYIHVICIV